MKEESLMEIRKISELSKLYERHNIPMNSMIELTYKCNFACKHCYVHNSNSFDIMSFDLVKEIIDQLSSLGVLNITISGGEPTLHKNLGEILLYIREKNMKPTLFTNGSLITDELIKTFIATGTDISLSLYGSDEKQYEITTGKKENYDMVYNNIEKIIENNISVVFKTIAISGLVEDISNMYVYAKGKNIPLAIETFIRPTLNGDTLNNVRPSEAQLLKIFSDFFSKEPTRRIRSNWCGAGKRTLCISPVGDVFPCPNLRLLLGNIKNNDLKSILFDNKLNDIIKDSEFSYMKNCIGCEAKEYCNACPGLWYEFSGCLDTPCKELCSINKLRYSVIKK